jgi:hypothetical protein
MHFRRRSGFLALFLVLFAGCEGCRDTSPSTTPGTAVSKTDAGKWQPKLFRYALNNLERLEEFHSEGMAVKILQQTQNLPQAAAAEGFDPLMAGWPEPEMLRQIVDRLNQWIRVQTPPTDAAEDPAVAALPETFRRLPRMRSLQPLRFVPFDGFALQEAVLLRDVAEAVQGETLDELSRAKNLFDWVIRNIQLEPHAADTVPQFPWEVLLFGRGTALERAWVFVLLARQAGLDAAVLAVSDPQASDGAQDDALQTWCVAALIEKEVYLFEPVLGLPIPGPGGVRLDAQRRLEIPPATLKQAAADETVLGRLSVEDLPPYPLKAADLKNVTAWIEASPTYLARRMKLLEPRFTGKRKLVLSISPAAELERWKKAAGISEAQLWPHPYETLRRRAALPVKQLQWRLHSYLPFYALGRVPISEDQFVQVPLYRGRILHLKGRFTEEDGALKCYQLARPSREEMAIYFKVMVEEFVAREMKGVKDLSEQEKNRRKTRLQQQAELECFSQLALISLGKQDASYWLGLAAYQRGHYSASVDYLSTRTLEVRDGGEWNHGALYNFARAVEADGELQRAALLYQSDPSAPDVVGRLLRAKWLQDCLEE